MAKYLRSPWNPAILQQSPLLETFRPFAAAWAPFDTDWPRLSDYQHMLDQANPPIVTHTGRPLTVVAQGSKPEQFIDHYAPRIYLTGEIQTRTENWHDFFQILTWLAFPKTKAAINAAHYTAALARHASHGETGRRSPIENTLSLFDECGAVIVSSATDLLDGVREFRWRTLFWEQRARLPGEFACLAFGHALCEKAFRPYVGLTANGLLLHVDTRFFQMTPRAQLTHIDARLAALFDVHGPLRSPQDLAPFPLLGMPGWWPDTTQATFYDDVRYFRPGRHRTLDKRAFDTAQCPSTTAATPKQQPTLLGTE